MKIDKYINKFYNKSNPTSVYEFFPQYEPKEYKGYYIFERILCFDIVQKQDDQFVCISQVGSIRYAKAFIDYGCVHGDYR